MKNLKTQAPWVCAGQSQYKANIIRKLFYKLILFMGYSSHNVWVSLNPFHHVFFFSNLLGNIYNLLCNSNIYNFFSKSHLQISHFQACFLNIVICSSGLAFQVHSCVAVKLLFYSWGNFLYRCWFRSNEIDAGAVHLTYLIDHESFWVCAHADRLICCSNVHKYNRWSAFAAGEFWDKSWKYIVPHLL